MAKNYLIVRVTGKAIYSTCVKAYKIVNNTPVFLGELHGQAEDIPVRYLSDILKAKGLKIDVAKAYRAGRINIHEIRL